MRRRGFYLNFLAINPRRLLHGWRRSLNAAHATCRFKCEIESVCHARFRHYTKVKLSWEFQRAKGTRCLKQYLEYVRILNRSDPPKACEIGHCAQTLTKLKADVPKMDQLVLFFFFCFRLWNRDATLMGLAGNLKYCLGYFTVPAAKSSVNAEILKLNHKRHTKIKQCPECETEKSYTPYYTKTWYVLRWTEESHARNQVLTFNLVITPILRFCRTWMLNLTCTNSVQILEPTVQR